ncbi:hypothetical protein BDZ45DRAFT_745685 [Acephala macrosclerotiorum]|nr:hypothetical protein BDZ45DRAFT_745685 [Acephala macrosclerotiorum]
MSVFGFVDRKTCTGDQVLNWIDPCQITVAVAAEELNRIAFRLFHGLFAQPGSVLPDCSSS